MLSDAFRDYELGIRIRYRTDLNCCSGQIPAGPGHWHSNKNTKLEGECMSSRRPIFAVVFATKKAINYSHENLFIRFYWYYYIKVNPFRVITVFRILCKLGLSHAV